MSEYQKRVNEAAGDLAVANPALLTSRGHLLELARAAVCESGYVFKKGHSRSKQMQSAAGSPEKTPKRPKITQEVRERRISDLNEEIKDLNKRIGFKERRVAAAANTKNFKACDEIQQEIAACKASRRELVAELREFERKKKRAKAYLASCEDTSSRLGSPSPVSKRRFSESSMLSESPSPSPSLSDSIASLYPASSSSSHQTGSPPFSPPMNHIAPLFSEDKNHRFERRLEEGYDVPDERDELWLCCRNNS